MHTAGLKSSLASVSDEEFSSDPTIGYNELYAAVEEYTGSMESQTHITTVDQLDAWDRKLRHLRNAIIQSKNISSKEREILFAGIRELRLDALLSESAIRSQIANFTGPSTPKIPQVPTDTSSDHA